MESVGGAELPGDEILDLLTRGLGAGLCVITRDFETRWANDVLKEIFGEVEGKICYETYNKQPNVCTWCGAKRVFESGHGPVKTIAVGEDKDGNEIYSQIVAIPFERTNGLVTSVLEFVLPITEHKQRERKLEQTLNRLRESEQRFRGAFEQAIVGVALVSPDGRFIETNGALHEMLGYSAEELLDTPFNDVTFVEDAEIGAEHLRRALAGDVEAVTFEKRYLHKNGDIVWARVSSRILRDRDGEPIHFVTHIHDVTASKGLERRLARAQKMEALGTLAGGIAHDFNNVLSAILGNSSLALMDAAEDSELQLLLRDVVRAADRGRDLVDKILAFSRVGRGAKRPTRVKEVVVETLQMLRAAVPTTIEIRQHLTSESTVLADPTHLHQVVMNLCTNAAVAMEREGGVLSVDLNDVTSTDELAVQHPGLVAGPYLRLSVSDTGCGIPAESRDRIFDPFFTTRPKGKGTGMGLAVVHGVVEDHQGAIEVESEPGEGTRFDVYLPICDDPGVGDTATERAPAMGSERILFVDDEQLQVDMARRILVRLGYQVTAMTSSQEALEAFASAPDAFDLVISDVTMPEISGDDLAQRMLTIRPDVPIILCTGFSERIDQRRADQIGVKGFIMKPLTINDLAAGIREVLDDAPSEGGQGQRR